MHLCSALGSAFRSRPSFHSWVSPSISLWRTGVYKDHEHRILVQGRKHRSSLFCIHLLSSSHLIELAKVRAKAIDDLVCSFAIRFFSTTLLYSSPLTLFLSDSYILIISLVSTGWYGVFVYSGWLVGSFNGRLAGLVYQVGSPFLLCCCCYCCYSCDMYANRGGV